MLNFLKQWWSPGVTEVPLTKLEDKIICSHCGLPKKPSEFYNAKKRKNGKQSRCKDCQNKNRNKNK